MIFSTVQQSLVIVVVNCIMSSVGFPITSFKEDNCVLKTVTLTIKYLFIYCIYILKRPKAAGTGSSH